MGDATYYVDESVKTTRESEVPDASFDNGVNNAASNASGIGINAGGGAVVGSNAQFTLEDQYEAARTPQNSQAIGGTAQPIQVGTSPTAAEKLSDPSVDGTVTATGEATLATLNAGWTAV